MSAAIEAGIEGIPAIGFSLLNYKWNADFEASKQFVKTISENVLKNGLPNGVVLNVIFPIFLKKILKVLKFAVKQKPIGLKSLINAKILKEEIIIGLLENL